MQYFDIIYNKIASILAINSIEIGLILLYYLTNLKYIATDRNGRVDFMKNSRETVLDILNRKNTCGKAFWMGHPNDATIPIYSEKWKVAPTEEALHAYLNDDCMMIHANGYKHPQGLPEFDANWGIPPRPSLSAPGCLGEAETIADIEAYPWPDPKYLDFSDTYAMIDKYQDKAVFTGVMSHFFHILSDFFGMETYFINMYENPVIVEAATEIMTDYFVAANEIFFQGLGDRADTFMIVNDFGTQLDLFISPECFRKFVLPPIKRIAAVARKYNKKVLLHSCGSIYRIIPDLIDAGIDAIHPIQAQAKGMSAAELVQYKNDLAFVGGIDAQTFIVNASPEEVAQEVFRVRDILGPNIVISPSHEEVLPNVPAENMEAMAKAAKV